MIVTIIVEDENPHSGKRYFKEVIFDQAQIQAFRHVSAELNGPGVFLGQVLVIMRDVAAEAQETAPEDVGHGKEVLVCSCASGDWDPIRMGHLPSCPMSARNRPDPIRKITGRVRFPKGSPGTCYCDPSASFICPVCMEHVKGSSVERMDVALNPNASIVSDVQSALDLALSGCVSDEERNLVLQAKQELEAQSR